MENLANKIGENPGAIVVIIGIMGIIGAVIGMYLAKRKARKTTSRSPK